MSARTDSSATYPGYGWMLQRSLWILVPILSMGMLTGPVLLLVGWRAKSSAILWPGAVYTGAAAVSFLMNQDPGAILRTLIWIFGTIHCLAVTPAWLRDRWRAAPVVSPRRDRPGQTPVPAAGADFTPLPGVTPESPAGLLLSDPGTQAAAYYASPSGDAGAGTTSDGSVSGGSASGAASGGVVSGGSGAVDASIGALLLNINAASERDLRQLPGIGRQRAAQTVRLRMEDGAFRSLEDYGTRLGLGPQGTERLRGRVSFGEGPPSRSSNNGYGRKVDY